MFARSCPKQITDDRVDGRRHVPPGGRADPGRPPLRATSSTRSTSPSSCSSATSCRGSSTRSTSRSRRPGTYRGQCAELCGTVPRVDAVRRPRGRPAHVSTPGSSAEQVDKAPRPTPAPAAVGRPVRRASRDGRPDWRPEHRLLDRHPPGAGGPAVHDRLQERRRRASRTTSRSRTPAARSKFKGDTITGVAESAVPGRRRCRPATTRSCAPSIRT